MLIDYTGISVGEIGPKLGFNTVNNGYLGFEKVRIPRDHLLMKHSQVLEVIFLNTIQLLHKTITSAIFAGWNLY